MKRPARCARGSSSDFRDAAERQLATKPMARDTLFLLIDAVRNEFGVRTGRNEWLNIATVGDLHAHISFVLKVRSDEARAALWPQVAAVVARVTGVPADQIRPDFDPVAPQVRRHPDLPANVSLKLTARAAFMLGAWPT